MREVPFVEVHSQLVEDWLKKLSEAPNDEAAAEILLDFVLARERARAGITKAGPRRDAIDRRTLKTLGNPTNLGPEFSRDEAIFRRLVSNPPSAVAYLKAAIEQRSRAQSDRASKGRPRRKDFITGDIEEIVAVDLSISAKEVGEKLRNVGDITLNEGEYRHKIDASTLKESNLASRVSDAKKRLLKSFSG